MNPLSTETGKTVDPEVVVVDLAKMSPQPGGALSPTSNAHLMAAYLELDPHDMYVTSRSVLGYSAGLAFLDVTARPGNALVDPPIAIEP